MKLIYFYLSSPPSLLPFFLVSSFVLFFNISPTPLLVWEIFFLKEKATGRLKHGPSRHPEKVYPGGEGHERGGR